MAMHANIITLPINQDAELLKLGEDLRIAWLRERVMVNETDGDAFEAACAASAEIVRRVEAIKATTLAGLRVKALAVLWCRVGDVPGETTDERLVGQIISTLLDI